MTLEPTAIRSQFPALQGPEIFFDNPGGSQVPRQVIRRMSAYLESTNANRGGAFRTSQDTDALILQARAAMADFLGASSPAEIIFGPNMTSLTFNLSRSLADLLRPEDEVVVTRLDHDANITPWITAAEVSGAAVRWADFDPETGKLDLDHLAQLLSPRTKLVAVGYASNALGTVNPLDRIIPMAKEVGAWIYVDAVQYAPHGPIDVLDLGCDFLVVSTYKFFGPHLGVLYGRHDLLERLPAYKVRPAHDSAPGKFETGTQNHEGIAGALGALEYLASLGAADSAPGAGTEPGTLRAKLRTAMQAIQSYESSLRRQLLEELHTVPGLRVYGHQADAVPTVSCTVEAISPRQLAQQLGEEQIYVWDGNFYALAVTEHLGLEGRGGLLRVGLAHYNTSDEIQRFGEALRSIVA